MILTLTAPSGAGKTTLALYLLTERRLPFRMLSSLSSRKPRETDLPNEYIYTTGAEIEKLGITGELLWSRQIHGNRYGTRTSDVVEALFSDIWYIMILVPEVLPLLHGRAQELDCATHIVSVFFTLPEAVLCERLIERGERPDQVSRRVLDCRMWAQAPEIGVCTHLAYTPTTPTIELAEQVIHLLAPEPASL